MFKNHFAICPEPEGIERFTEEILKAGYTKTKMFLKIKWEDPVDFNLLKKIIKFNVADKASCTSFWRK